MANQVVRFLMVLVLTQASHAFAGAWELIDEKDGIKIFKREEANSNIISFAGESVIDAAPATISAVLADHKRKGEWMANLMEARTMHEFSPLSSIVYSAFRSPGFISNRDFVYKYDFKVDAKTGVVHLAVQSTEQPGSPETVGVRGHLNYSAYTMEPVGPGKTKFRGEINVDPKGLLPTWLVNITQKSWPYKTLSGLREQVKKPNIGEHPGIKAELAKIVAH